MNKQIIRNLTIPLALIVFVACLYFGRSISFKDQWPLYEALRSTSSIIFAVIGAWLTILYPEALKKIFSKGLNLNESKMDSIDLLIANIRYSTLILACILLIGFVAQIAKQVPLIYQYYSDLRGLSFGILGVLTFLQIWTLLMALAQAEIAREDINVSASRKKRATNFSSEVTDVSSPASKKNLGD